MFIEKLAFLKKNIAEVCTSCGRDSTAIKILAVTKSQPASVWKDLCKINIWGAGESRIQETESKITEWIGNRPRLELIGHLQTNKAHRAVALFDRIQSVDSIRLLKKINEAAGLLKKTPYPILLQINTGNDPNKFGADTKDTKLLMAYALQECPFLRVEGLMAIAPLHTDPKATFEGLRLQKEQLQNDFSYPLTELSMGMSQDYKIAIQEGSTLLRIGSLLFED